MDTDLQILIVGVLVAFGLLAIAYALLKRGKLEAQATRDAALRRAATDTAAEKRVLGDLEKQFQPLRDEMEARQRDMDAHLSTVYERLDALEHRAAGHGDQAALEAIRAQLRSNQDQLNRQNEDSRAQFRSLETDIIQQLRAAEIRIAALTETLGQFNAVGHPLRDQLPSHDNAPVVPRHEPETNHHGLSGAQVQALSHVYWELEAVAGAVQQKLGGIPGGDDTTLSGDYAEQLRNMPVLPAEQVREEIQVLGNDAALLFDTVHASMDRLRAGRGPTTAGALRRLLTTLADDVRTLLSRLEEIMAVHEA